MARRKRAKPDPEQLPISFEAQAPEAQHDEAQHDEEQRGEEQRGEEQRVLAFQLRPGDRVTVARPRLGGGRSPGQLPGRKMIRVRFRNDTSVTGVHHWPAHARVTVQRG